METLASNIAAPANAETALDSTAEVDTEASQSLGDGTAPSATEAGTPGTKVKDPIQERFDKLTRDKYDALREGDRKGYLLEQRERELAELRTRLEARETTQAAPANDFPTLEQFGYDEGKYQAAVAAHVTKIATEQGKTAAQAALNAERERQSEENANKSWAERQAELIKSKPDYVEKVLNAPGLPISTEIQKVLKGHELGPQIALHMVENAEASLAIMRLPQHLQLIEVGRIAAKLELAKLQPKPLVSQAPPPVNKVETNDAVVEKSPSDMSDTEFAKWRKKQISARRNS